MLRNRCAIFSPSVRRSKSNLLSVYATHRLQIDRHDTYVTVFSSRTRMSHCDSNTNSVLRKKRQSILRTFPSWDIRHAACVNAVVFANGSYTNIEIEHRYFYFILISFVQLKIDGTCGAQNTEKQRPRVALRSQPQLYWHREREWVTHRMRAFLLHLNLSHFLHFFCCRCLQAKPAVKRLLCGWSTFDLIVDAVSSAHESGLDLETIAVLFWFLCSFFPFFQRVARELRFYIVSILSIRSNVSEMRPQ